MTSSLIGLILITTCICRSLTSKIVRLGLADDKFLYGNYMGQDRLFSYPYSYLVPKASPLKVSKSIVGRQYNAS